MKRLESKSLQLCHPGVSSDDMGRAPCGAEARGMFSSKTLKTIHVRGFHLMSYVREGTALGLVTLMPIIIHYHHKKTMSYCKHEVRTVDSGFRNSEVSANVLFKV